MAIVALFSPAAVRAEVICTLVLDASSGQVVHETGDCDSPITPASTFKVPLAVMGYDAGILIDATAPTLPFVQGYPDWGGAVWRRDTGPAHWMRHSVVWYSQRIAEALGADRLRAYGLAMGYGNADFSGDPGQNNGLERSWISSSLLISPREQARFVRDLVNRQLAVSMDAMDRTVAIVEAHRVGEWTFWGKTGSAYPRRADGSFDRGRGLGWYAGWAARGEALVVVVRLHQADGPGDPNGGTHTRDRLFAEWETPGAFGF